MMRMLFVLFFSVVFVSTIKAQESTQLKLEEYMDWVRSFHPVMQQARLLTSQADANLLSSRGTFDPKAFGSYERKSFDQKNYFQVGEAGIKIPTWIGADVKDRKSVV